MTDLVTKLRQLGDVAWESADALERLTTERDALAETIREIEAKTHKHPYGIAQEVNALCTRHAFTAILAARDARIRAAALRDIEGWLSTYAYHDTAAARLAISRRSLEREIAG